MKSLGRYCQVFVVGLLALALLSGGVVALLSGGVIAQDELKGDESGEAGEGDELLSVSGWVAVGAFVLGAAILLVSVEILIHALVRTAARFGVSALLLAVVVSGTEVDNVAFGVFTGFRELQNVGFGLAIGNAISIFGLTLAVAAILYPFEVSVPDDYLVLMVLSPLLLVPFLLAGTMTAIHGAILVLAYVAIFAYLANSELRGDRSYMRSSEVIEAATSADGEGRAVGDERASGLVRRLTGYDWFWPAVMVAALLGIVIGAETASAGTEGIVQTWNLDETIFGVTLVTIIFTLDDLLLTVEPVRLGYEDVAVGGIVGSLLFFVTANAGLVAIVGSVTTSARAVAFHLPALLVFAALSGYLLRRGRLTRRAGTALLALYLGYLTINIVFFATLPVSG